MGTVNCRRQRVQQSGNISSERPLTATLQRKITCVKMLMDTMEAREELRKEEIVLSRLQEEEQKKERVSSKEEESEAAEFNRLHSLLPFLGSKSVTELDIVLEAITYIHLLQARLQGGPQRQSPC